MHATPERSRARPAEARRRGAWGPAQDHHLRERLEELAGDDHLLDLVRALADLAELGVAHVALDVELARVAVTAVDLHGGVARPHRGARRVVLRRRRLLRRLELVVL